MFAQMFFKILLRSFDFLQVFGHALLQISIKFNGFIFTLLYGNGCLKLKGMRSYIFCMWIENDMPIAKWTMCTKFMEEWNHDI